MKIRIIEMLDFSLNATLKLVRPYALSGAVIFFFLPLTGCENNKQDHGPLKVGTNVWIGYEPLHLAKSLGAFGDAVHLVEYSSSSQVIRAIRNGVIDVAALTLDEVLILLEQQQSLKILLVTDISDGADSILSYPDIKTLETVQGKTIGVESSALGAYFLTRALTISGVQESEVKIKHLEVDEHESAYQKRLVDVIVTFDPVRSKLLMAGAREIFTSRQIPGEIVDVLVVREGAIANHLDDIETLKSAWYKALDYMSKEPNDAAKILSHRLRIPISEVKKSYLGVSLPNKKENDGMVNNGINSSLVETANRLAEIMLQNKLLKTPVEPLSLFIDKQNNKN